MLLPVQHEGLRGRGERADEWLMTKGVRSFDFDFTAGLENATCIRLAVAFGHMTFFRQITDRVGADARSFLRP